MTHRSQTLPAAPRPRTSAALWMALRMALWVVLAMLPPKPASAASNDRPAVVPKWGRFAAQFTSKDKYKNPFQEAQLDVNLVSPSGARLRIPGFWDGGKSWKFRFCPTEVGTWTYSTECSDRENDTLHARGGSFIVTAHGDKQRFDRHGPVRVSNDGYFFLHQDGRPFFWLADTAWNGPLKSSREDWDYYLAERKRQGFTATQFVATQWRAAPRGNRERQLAYKGTQEIEISPRFFQAMDERVDAVNRAGMLAVPVMLWAIPAGSSPEVNPGISLPEDQAILLARHMLARWGGNHVAWFLGGDGDYQGENAEKWKRIGAGVFGGYHHAPATLHPMGMRWIQDDYLDEEWYGFVGYQSGHGDDAKTLSWLAHGPPAREWLKTPHRPFINLEPPYEFHTSYQSGQRITPDQVRRGVYRSLLVAPTAGVSYGAHGVWGWDDGKSEPTDHPGTGVPLRWKQALRMPGGEQMAHVAKLFESFDYWRLRPAPYLLAGALDIKDPATFVAVSRTDRGDLTVAYTPLRQTVTLRSDLLPSSFDAEWHSPATGAKLEAVAETDGLGRSFSPPGEGDWTLVVRAK